MAVRIKSITFDCADPYRLAQFWSQLTGFIEDPDNRNAHEDPEGLLLSPDGSLALLFIAVPEPKQVKNRVHLDLVPLERRQDEEVDRLLGIGARVVADMRRPDGAGWVVLADPEGNEFCIGRSDVERAPSVEQLGRAFDAVGDLITNIQPEQWSAPTPCTDWTVRQLVQHLLGMNRVFAALLADEPAPAPAADHVEDDPVRAYRDSAAALQAAFDQPEVLQRTYHGPLGAATGAERLQIRLYDLLAHGWDLAQATGQPAELPDDLAEQSLAFVRIQLSEQGRPGRFNRVQMVAAQAPAIERLVAFLGRPVSATPRATVVSDRLFDSADGTRLAYRRTGTGRTLICIPGGPMQASAYLGDLGGLQGHHSTLLLDLRGTGKSAVPAERASYRCDRQVDDVEALRRHVGLDRLDLAAHSAGATLALMYAARYPERISRLVLITPSPRAVGLEVTDADRRQVADLRRDEPWFADAFAAFERIWSGDANEADWSAITPFTYGRWDAAAQSQHAREATELNADAASRYYAPDAVDTTAVRSALAVLHAPVLLVAGEYDVALPPQRAAEYAELFPHAEMVVLPRGGHFPWLDDPERFVTTVTRFLRQ